MFTEAKNLFLRFAKLLKKLARARNIPPRAWRFLRDSQYYIISNKVEDNKDYKCSPKERTFILMFYKKFTDLYSKQELSTLDFLESLANKRIDIYLSMANPPINPLETPKDFDNKTDYASVFILNSWRIVNISNAPKVTVDDVFDFKSKHRGSDINDYILLIIPLLGRQFVKRKFVNFDKPFLYNVDERTMFIKELTNFDERLFQSYVDVFIKKPVDVEYELCLYATNKSMRHNVNQWFSYEILQMKGE